MPLKNLPEFLRKSKTVKRNIYPERIDSVFYPLVIFRERDSFPATGRVIISDIDKTYLNTDFESLKGLMWIPLEVAVDKVTIDRMNLVYQALRHGRGDQPVLTPFVFVTASPPFLFSPLSDKMLRDGVEYDVIAMKDQPALFKRFEFDQLRSQVTFKLFALFEILRLMDGKRHSLILFGDDTESDLQIYLLFKKIVEEKPRMFRVADLLLENGVSLKYMEKLLKLIREFYTMNVSIKVDYIFIYLSKGEFLPGGVYPPVVEYTSSSQVAIFLFEKKLINRYYLEKIVSPESEEYFLATEWLRDYGYL